MRDVERTTTVLATRVLLVVMHCVYPTLVHARPRCLFLFVPSVGEAAGWPTAQLRLRECTTLGGSFSLDVLRRDGEPSDL